MTTPPYAMNGRSNTSFRVLTLLFATLLAIQGFWLLFTEWQRPGIVSMANNGVSAGQRDRASWAASIGAIRGDLWTEAALTYAALIVGDQSGNTEPRPTDTVASAYASVKYAVEEAPTQSSAWLLLAQIALRYPLENFEPKEALRMSYYTGPSEHTIVPLRLRLSVQTNAFYDVQIREFVRRDLRALLERKEYDDIADAYYGASTDAQHYIERTVGDLDPAALVNLQTKFAHGKGIPN